MAQTLSLLLWLGKNRPLVATESSALGGDTLVLFVNKRHEVAAR